jgi:hypothetical protein
MSNKFVKISKQLYPTGRAFRVAEGSELEKLHEALSESESKLDLDSLSILNSVLPDNDNFTELDAELWENRLGLITNPDVSLEDRKLAIIRKMNHPGDIPARQSWDYLQDRLRSAGFDVYVHENLTNVSPQDVLALNENYGQLGTFQLDDQQLGDVYSYYGNLFNFFQLDDQQLGFFQLNEYSYNHKVANNIFEEKDYSFNVGANYKSTFFIGGEELGSFADIDVNRKLEFRQLILRIKPVQTVGFLFINYI